MESRFGRNHRTSTLALTTTLLVAVFTGSTSVGNAGTRVIPPPPSRHKNENSLDGIQQVSEWGVFPGQDRWSALEDEEGAEIDFNRGTLSRRPAANRAPAGLEVATTPRNSNGGGWKSATVDDTRRISKDGNGTNGSRPILNRVTRSETARQDEQTEKFVSDMQDPIARRKGIQEISIIAGDLGFFPKTIFVSRDVPVRIFITGASKGSLCIMMDSFNVRKQVRANKIEEITFIPNQPGTYRYYCPVNGSEGTMVVKELTTTAPDAS